LVYFINKFCKCSNFSKILEIFSHKLRATDFHVQFGSANVQHEDVKVGVKRIAVPEPHRDIALLQLKQSVSYKASIFPICIPKEAFVPHNSSQCEAVGFGTGKHSM